MSSASLLESTGNGRGVQVEVGEWQVARKHRRAVVHKTKANLLWEGPNVGRKQSRVHLTGAMRKVGSSTTLPVIPEADELDLALENREVLVVSVLECPEYFGADFVKAILNEMHEVITGHVNFTSIKNGPEILELAYARAQVSFSKVSLPEDINPRISCTTALISGNEVCLAHVGRCHTAIISRDGQLAQVTKPHDDSRGFGASMNWVPDTCHFQVQVPEASKFPRSRSPAPKRRASLSDFIPNIFSTRSTDSDIRRDEDTSTPSVVVIIGSSGIWGALGRDKVSEEFFGSLALSDDDINLATKSLVQKASKKMTARFESMSACVLRWSKDD